MEKDNPEFLDGIRLVDPFRIARKVIGFVVERFTSPYPLMSAEDYNRGASPMLDEALEE